ncbi:phosphoesterase RecJ domain protein [Methanosalsum zhilinae DSM 4017]|uniref:Phosphoesterase RecJ domain protein n=1 Tax=Methanosalsum zhilinae (strain DSM 4017 / NBRC 107636 / OCM 62 / WeN5) TaxID=679901 RepID=F7XQB8_METZD|nr:DHH family phosphoesterase [Methanosalsum zhilinae]AEH61581.1 phosphoesterase RecJ domain protein [Methanosalsum zhilinae DSM 4017]
MSNTYQYMKQRASKCAEKIRNQQAVHVVSHIDADGLTSAGIICRALERANIEYSVQFVKQLDEMIITKIADQNPELVIFTDLGSGMLETIENCGINAIVSDHHHPKGDTEFHLNPHLFGANGSSELSGSGTTYILASQMGDNTDLADLAIVGAVGDLQHVKKGKLTGLNREILAEGVKINTLSCARDITLFGKQTRPVFKLLQFASDPYIPGLTGNEDGCIEFLAGMDLPLGGDERWRRWIDLEREEKQKIVSALFQHSLRAGVEPYKIERLVGEVYTLLNEREGTEMRDASEYSTLLNATARYDHAEVGLAVCMGDREQAYESARRLLSEHRQNLVQGLLFVKENGVIQLNNLQYFDAGSSIRETIVGIIAGMSTSIVDNRNLPIIAFADTDDGVKVSARATQDLIRKGINLSRALSQTCEEIGGSGGGHDIAAGATIPSILKEEFITRLDEIIGAQISSKRGS